MSVIPRVGPQEREEQEGLATRSRGSGELLRSGTDRVAFTVRVEVVPDWLSGELDAPAQVTLQEEASGTEHEVVLDGLAGSRSLPGGSYTASSFTSGGWQWLFETDGPASAGRPELHLRVLDTAYFMVEAVDADTGQPVRELELWDLDWDGDADDLGPAARTVLAERHPEQRPGGADGAWVVTRMPPARTAYQVRSPGYGTQSFDREPFGRQVRVPMRRAASLTVHCVAAQEQGVGSELGYSLTLSATHPNPGVLMEWQKLLPAGEERAHWEGLRPGTYRLTVRRPGSLGAAPLLMREDLSLLPGEHKRIDVPVGLEAHPPSTARIVILGGDAEKGSRERLSIELQERVGGEWRTTGHDGPIGWSGPRREPFVERTYDRIAPGWYRFRLDPVGLMEEVELLPGRTQEVVFDLHQVSKVRVQLVGGIAGTRQRGVVWGYVERGEEVAGSVSVGSRDVAELLADGRPIWLQATAYGAASELLAHDVEPGETNVVLLELRPELGAVVEMSLEPPQVAVDGGFWTTLRVAPAGHGGRCDRIAIVRPAPFERPSGRSHGIGRFVLSAPGTYQVDYEDSRGVRRQVPFEARPGIQSLVLPFE